MIVKVYKEQEKQVKTIYLKLEREEEIRQVILKCVDANGEDIPSGNILSITEEGQIMLFKGVNKFLGFQLVENDVVKVTLA